MEGLAQGHRWLLVTASFNPVLWGSASLCTHPPPPKLIPASHLHPPQSNPKDTRHLPPMKPPSKRQVGFSTAQAPQGSPWLGMAVETEVGWLQGVGWDGYRG